MPALRSKIVSHANRGVRNRAQIHYLQLRPIDGIGQPRKLPLSTDCSGWVTDCYNWSQEAAYHRPPIRYLNGLAERPDDVPPSARELQGAWNPPTESEELVAAAIEDE